MLVLNAIDAGKRTPWDSFRFVLPWLIVYELACLASGTPGCANQAEWLLRTALVGLGFEGRWILPTLVAASLLVWQGVSLAGWRMTPGWALTMMAESAVAALPIVAISAIPAMLAPAADEASTALALVDRAWMADGSIVVAAIGAGIYEETLFRLILLPLGALFLLRLGTGRRTAWTSAVVISSLSFAACHALTASTVLEGCGQFAFGLLAGVWLAIVFVGRGFGVAVGTHLVYDLWLAST